jgi:hypothetical protein
MSELDEIPDVPTFYKWVHNTVYADRCKALFSWDPRPMVAQNPTLVPHVLMQMLNTGGDYSENFVAWFDQYEQYIPDDVAIDLNTSDARKLYLQIAGQ